MGPSPVLLFFWTYSPTGFGGPYSAFVLDAEGHGVPVTADGSGSVEGASITDRLQPIGGWSEFREVKPED